MRNLIIYTGKDGAELLKAALDYNINPTSTNKKKFDDLHEEMSKKFDAREKENRAKFIELYGEAILNFILQLCNYKTHTFASVSYPYNFQWCIKDDSEESGNLWCIEFRNGEFNYYIIDIRGYGYTILEKNISKERVIELWELK
jgi:hypothetical protein